MHTKKHRVNVFPEKELSRPTGLSLSKLMVPTPDRSFNLPILLHLTTLSEMKGSVERPGILTEYNFYLKSVLILKILFLLD